MARNDLPPKPLLRRIPRKVWIGSGILLLVLAVATGTMNLWLAPQIERRIDRALGERGWKLERSRAAWSPWSGLRFEHPRLRRGAEAPAVEADRLDLGLTLSRLLRGDATSSDLEIQASPLVLRDADGEVRLDQVSLKLVTGKDKIEIREAKAKAAGLLVETSGEVLLGSGKGSETFQPRFNAVRGVLAALPIPAGSFKVSGKFTVDLSGPTAKWTANLAGHGKDLAWRQLPLREASSQAVLNEGDSVVTADLGLPEGKSHFTIHKPGWQTPGFDFEGTLADAADRSDSFHGRYLGNGAWTVDEAQGEADLWSMAQRIPDLAGNLPKDVNVETFPRIELRGLAGDRSGKLKLHLVTLSGKGKASAKAGERKATLTDLSGSASFDGEAWHLKRAGGKSFGGTLQASGAFHDGILDDATITISGFRLSELKAWKGGKSVSKGILSGAYRGRLGADRSELAGEGEMRLVNAPVFDVPLLAETAELFRAMIPGADTAKTGEFNASFKAHKYRVEVTRFEATGGSLEVSARGHIDLAKRRVDGVARGKLSGLPGLVTQPLSRLLEMEVSGPYDDIRVKPQGPTRLVSNAASGTVGTAVDTVAEAGKVTGTVLKEGIKLPFRWLDRDEEEK